MAGQTRVFNGEENSTVHAYQHTQAFKARVVLNDLRNEKTMAYIGLKVTDSSALSMTGKSSTSFAAAEPSRQISPLL